MQYKNIIRIILGIIIFLILFNLFLYNKIDDFTSFPQSSQEIMESTVLIINLHPNGTIINYGTGVIINKKGYILTVSHNYDDPSSKLNITSEKIIEENGFVQLANNINKEICKVKHIDIEKIRKRDLILLKIDENFCQDINSKQINLQDIDLKPIEFSKQLKKEDVGKEIGFVGYNQGPDEAEDFANLFIGKGTISNTNLKIKELVNPFYSLNTYSTFGFSGGPIFLADSGKVISIISRGYFGAVFVPPIYDIPEIIKEYEKNNT